MDDYYKTRNNCKLCEAENVAALPLLIAAMCVILYLMYKVANYHTQDNLQATLGMGTSFGLWFNYMQFASLFRSFEVNWPDPVSDFLTWFSWTNLNFALFSPDCSIPVDYKTSLIMRMVLPFFVLGT